MLVFPTFLFNPRSVLPQLVGGVISGGQTIGGTTQTGEMSGGGMWSIEQKGVILRPREKLMAWRAMASAADNGATPMIVPIGDRKHQPVTPAQALVPFNDTSVFEDGSMWVADEVDAIVSSSAALRATQIAFAYASPERLIGGEFFSILHGGNKGWRLYQIARVISGGLGTNDATVVQFNPPLRAAVASSTPLNFDSPRCVCKVVGGLGALYDRIDKFGSADATFMETFPAVLA